MGNNVKIKREKEPKVAILGAEAIAASTPYVLVDLSDTTNFSHDSTNGLRLFKLILSTEKASDGIFDIWIGVVTENDATNGTAEWIQAFHLEASGNPTDSSDRFFAEVDFTCGGALPDGLNLKVDADNDTLLYVLTNQTQAGHANWQNDTNRASPAGAATKPGEGDIVVWVEEVGGTGTIDIFLTVIYESF